MPDVRGLFQAGAAQLDETVSDVLQNMTDALSTGLAGFIHTFQPERIVLGGGVADSLQPYLATIRRKTKERTLPAMFEGVGIQLTALGSRAGMLGAAAQLWEYREGDMMGSGNRRT